MDAESGYDAGSEKSPFTSDISLQDSAKKKEKPCEICGSFANELLIMTCFNCRDTREHTYCARVLLRSVPFIWLCEDCRNCSSLTLTAVKTANHHPQVEEAMDPIDEASQSLTNINQVVDNQDSVPHQISTPSRTKVVDYDQTAPSNKDSIEVVTPSARTTNHQMEQVVPVVPYVHQYTTEESSLEPSYPISPCSVHKPVWGRIPSKLSQYVDLSSDSACEE